MHDQGPPQRLQARDETGLWAATLFVLVLMGADSFAHLVLSYSAISDMLTSGKVRRTSLLGGEILWAGPCRHVIHLHARYVQVLSKVGWRPQGLSRKGVQS